MNQTRAAARPVQMTRFIVTRAPGPNWDQAKPTRAQAGWHSHAAFMDTLAGEGFAAYGGPAGNKNKVVLAVDAPDEATIRARLARDPWAPARLLRTVTIEPWTIWLGSDEQIDPSRQLHLVAYAPGPHWDHAKPGREQVGWNAHAEFMDALANQRIVIVGGPLDEHRALLVIQHDDEHGLRARLGQDPWSDRILTVERVEPWTLWHPPRLRCSTSGYRLTQPRP